MPSRLFVVLFAVGVSIARASVPVGGMDLFADYWLTNPTEHNGYTRPDGPLGAGPFRLSVFAWTISNIQNNTGNAASSAYTLSIERLLHGPFLVGASIGTGQSSTLQYSHGEAHGGLLVNDMVVVRLGFNSDTYDYTSNKTVATNIARDLLQGLELGADLFGSPAQGWFLQLSADLIPLQSDFVGGGARGSKSYTVRGHALLGFTAGRNLDVTLTASAVNGLGDLQSIAAHLGAGVSLSF